MVTAVTVEELIKLLKNHDPKAIIEIPDNSDYGDILTVDRFNIDKGKLPDGRPTVILNTEDIYEYNP